MENKTSFFEYIVHWFLYKYIHIETTLSRSLEAFYLGIDFGIHFIHEAIVLYLHKFYLILVFICFVFSLLHQYF